MTAITTAYDEGAVAGGVELNVFPAGVLIVVLGGLLFLPAGAPTTSADLQLIITNAVIAYFGELPIGGLATGAGTVVPASGVLAAIMNAVTQAVGPIYAPGVVLEMTLNGVLNGDVPIGPIQIPELVNLLAVVFT